MPNMSPAAKFTENKIQGQVIKDEMYVPPGDSPFAVKCILLLLLLLLLYLNRCVSTYKHKSNFR
jgi:hypothetical protein